jgi:superoxide dismutase, Fe-Mn family
MAYKLAQLDYAYDALEPYIDRETMELHHSKHHQKYVDSFNNAVKDTIWQDKTPEEIFPVISKVPDAVANNAGQVYNHNLFWKSMAPFRNSLPIGPLSESIHKQFGSIDAFQKEFFQVAASQFGSGWAWLLKQGDRLIITSTSNHINPLMDIADIKGKPIFCLDVWEHAYYLKYKNKRPDFIEAYWNIVNWEDAGARFNEG